MRREFTLSAFCTEWPAADILVCEDNGEENGKEKSYTEKNRSGNETRQRERWKGGGGIDVAIKVMKA